MGAKGRAPKKESKCDNNCAKYVTGVAHFKIVFRAVFGLQGVKACCFYWVFTDSASH
jgi:hypothetical protein